MSNDYLWDRSGEPDHDVQRLEDLLAPLAHTAPLDELRPRRRRIPYVVLATVACAAAAIVLWLARPRQAGDPSPCGRGSGFSFTAVGGDVTCGGGVLARGVLPVGGELETGAHEAVIAIADIGRAELGPGTRVRLERSDPQRHQLALDRGRLHAKVNAPPRLFAVSTPGAEIVDLGCEYTIVLDGHGEGSIAVQTGRVELSENGAVVVAPEGTAAAMLGGKPGLPVDADASAELAAAAQAYQRCEPAAFDVLLSAARPRDAITVVALAAVDLPGRARALARLVELAPPPGDITPDTALRDPSALAAWRDAIVASRRSGGKKG
jgi:ferric-dicitrate binding protein FerR (iron transport regulator)